MRERFAGKVGVITGAASGIGAATARRLAAEGARLVLSDIDEDAGREVARQLEAHFVRADVADPAQVRVFLESPLDARTIVDPVSTPARALRRRFRGGRERATDALMAEERIEQGRVFVVSRCASVRHLLGSPA